MNTTFRLATITAALAGGLWACGDDAGRAGDGALSAADGGLVGDQGAPGDACLEPSASCEVLFSYPRDEEVVGPAKVELWGDFNGWSTGVPMKADGARWVARIELDHLQRVLYKFVIDGEQWVRDPDNPDFTDDGYENSIRQVSCPRQVPCADPPLDSGVVPQGDGGPPPPAFDWRDAVMYFVLVDRFDDGDPGNNKPEPDVEPAANYQGGDLAGLLSRIKSGYFDDLGVNALWLSSPLGGPTGKYLGSDGHDYTGYHGYWPTDLDKVDARIGDLGLLKQVVSEAHARGIRVVLDYVMNHVHSQSPAFTSHPQWFWPLDKQGNQCVCGGGCDWEWDRVRCWFTPYLPDFNFLDPAARKFSVDNAMYWAKQTGIDGYRLDAIKHVEMSWLTDLRSRLNAEVAGRFYLVGETFTGDKGLIKQYVDPGTKLDGQFDFPLRAELVRVILRRQGGFAELDGFLNANDGFYGAGSIMSTFLGNHDLPRVIHLAEDTPQFDDWDGGKSRAWDNRPGQPGDANPYQRLAVAFTALLTLPGVPLIYYGDEVGLAGGGDPDNRRMMPFSGLNSHQSWLKQRIAALTKLRAAHPALRRGARKEQWISADVYAYRMTEGSDELVVVLNRSDQPQQITLPGNSYVDLLGQGTVQGSAVQIPARSALILQ